MLTFAAMVRVPSGRRATPSTTSAQVSPRTATAHIAKEVTAAINNFAADIMRELGSILSMISLIGEAAAIGSNKSVCGETERWESKKVAESDV